MKTMLKVTLVIAFAAIANTLFAVGNLKLNILPVSAEKAVVTISSLTNSNFSITINNENDQTVYYNESSVASENYRKVYNFSDLDDGTYKLTVVSGDFTTERQFEKKRGVINVFEERTTIKPFFDYDAGILRLSFLNFTNDKMTLYLYKDNQLIHTKTLGKGFIVNEALNLSKLEFGKYSATLTSGGKDYYYNIPLK